MAKEVIKQGEIPQFYGICGVCGTEFIADAEDCELEVYETGFSRQLVAHTTCPVCNQNTEVFKYIPATEENKDD